MHERLEKWCFEELNKLLGSPSEEIVRYVLDIQVKEELEEFLVDLFGHLSSDVREKFTTDLLSLRKELQSESSPEEQGNSGILQKPVAQNDHQPTAYRKPELEDFSSLGHGLSGNGNSKNKHKGKKIKPQPETSITNNKGHVVLDPILHQNNEISSRSSGGTKQRHSGKFVPLYDTCQVVLLPGRHPCLCQATEHALINNCIKCGRIVCVQEGSGPCFTCSALVCTPEEQDILRRGSRKSEKLANQLKSAPDQDLLRKATEHKNKLLEYSITSAQRTQVIDDECDYFSLSESKWISEDERKALQKKAKDEHDSKHASRFGKNFTLSLDLEARKVTLEDNFGGKSTNKAQSLAAEVSRLQLSSERASNRKPIMQNVGDQDVHPMIDVLPPVYEPRKSSPSSSNNQRTDSELQGNGQKFRLQDRELQELSDQGFCLSMHQPWASLLVRGIKIHEGRSWYTAYRGPLWIHSGSKTPLKQDITETEAAYRLIHENGNIDFPKQYPVSCLLGCVTLVDCLQQEEYRRQYPSGESASPYVFICESPQELIVKIPMSGKAKIFKLDPNLHKTVKKTLRKLNESKFN